MQCLYHKNEAWKLLLKKQHNIVCIFATAKNITIMKFIVIDVLCMYHVSDEWYISYRKSEMIQNTSSSHDLLRDFFFFSQPNPNLFYLDTFDVNSQPSFSKVTLLFSAAWWCWWIYLYIPPTLTFLSRFPIWKSTFGQIWHHGVLKTYFVILFWNQQFRLPRVKPNTSTVCYLVM